MSTNIGVVRFLSKLESLGDKWSDFFRHIHWNIGKSGVQLQLSSTDTMLTGVLPQCLNWVLLVARSFVVNVYGGHSKYCWIDGVEVVSPWSVRLEWWEKLLLAMIINPSWPHPLGYIVETQIVTCECVLEMHSDYVAVLPFLYTLQYQQLSGGVEYIR